MKEKAPDDASAPEEVPEAKDLTRRAFLSGWGGSTLTVAALLAAPSLTAVGVGSFPVRQGPPDLPQHEGRLLRPPGAVDEEEFLALCIRCFKCAEACTPRAIRFYGLKGASSETPYIAPWDKGCELTMSCVEACPTGALARVKEEEVFMGVAEVDSRLCLPYLREGICEVCYQFCPFKGRAITQGIYLAPTVVAEHCVGCGWCEEECIVPERAIRVRPITAEERAALRAKRLAALEEEKRA